VNIWAIGMAFRCRLAGPKFILAAPICFCCLSRPQLAFVLDFLMSTTQQRWSAPVSIPPQSPPATHHRTVWMSPCRSETHHWTLCGYYGRTVMIRHLQTFSGHLIRNYARGGRRPFGAAQKIEPKASRAAYPTDAGQGCSSGSSYHSSIACGNSLIARSRGPSCTQLGAIPIPDIVSALK